MKEAARHWIDFAQRDLQSARILAKEPALAGISVFHSQQCVEKLLEAILENEGLAVAKTHDLERLMALVRPVVPDLELDEDLLSLLSSFYLDSRYPPTVAFPCGDPAEEDARGMLAFADKTQNAVHALLHS